MGGRLGRGDPAQHVVAAEAEQDERGLARRMVEHEGQPLPPRRGRVARNTRVLNPRRHSVGGERGLKLGGQPLLGSPPVTGLQRSEESSGGQSEPVRVESGGCRSLTKKNNL